MTLRKISPSLLTIGQADRAQGSITGRSDSPPAKTPADKPLPHGERGYEGENQPSEWSLDSFITDYIKAKRKAAQEDQARPPWWPTLR